MTAISWDQYEALCDVLDRAKTDPNPRDTDVYALDALRVLGLEIPQGSPITHTPSSVMPVCTCGTTTIVGGLCTRCRLPVDISPGRVA